MLLNNLGMLLNKFVMLLNNFRMHPGNLGTFFSNLGMLLSNSGMLSNNLGMLLERNKQGRKHGNTRTQTHIFLDFAARNRGANGVGITVRGRVCELLAGQWCCMYARCIVRVHESARMRVRSRARDLHYGQGIHSVP